MNIITGALWAVYTLLGVGLFAVLIWWVLKPIHEADKTKGIFEDYSMATWVSVIKRGCVAFIILTALLLDQCDGKFLT